MSQPAARLGDKDTGHPGAGPTPVITASSNVIINGKGAARKGDKLKKHHKGTRVIVGGSGSVLINGKPAARVGDGINCGGVMIQGASNVLIGDSPVMQAPREIVFRQDRIHNTAAAPEQTARHRAQALHHHVPVENTHHDDQAILKDVIIRLDIDPTHSPNASNAFILSSTDGQYTRTQTAANDKIVGDQYLDLEYTALDVSKNYRLIEIDSSDGEQTRHFDDTPFEAFGQLSPAAKPKKAPSNR